MFCRSNLWTKGSNPPDPGAEYRLVIPECTMFNQDSDDLYGSYPCKKAKGPIAVKSAMYESTPMQIVVGSPWLLAPASFVPFTRTYVFVFLLDARF